MTTTPRSTPAPEQLALLGPDHVPDRFRMSERTRRIGLAGAARARQALDEARRRRLEREAELESARAERSRPRRAA